MRKIRLAKCIFVAKFSTASPPSTLRHFPPHQPTKPERSHPFPVARTSNVRTHIISILDIIAYPLRHRSISLSNVPPPRRNLQSREILPTRRGSPNLRPRCPSRLCRPRRKGKYRNKDAQAQPRACSLPHHLKCRC